MVSSGAIIGNMTANANRHYAESLYCEVACYGLVIIDTTVGTV